MLNHSDSVTPRQQLMLDKCKELIIFIEQTMHLVMPIITVLFNLTGATAGQAMHTRTGYGMRFNKDMIEGDSFDHIYNETLPHELAHIVCFAHPAIGHGHSRGWKRMCIKLGGNGKRTHSEEILYACGITYLYYTSTNREVRVSSIVHKKIQNGKTYRCKDGSALNSSCKYVALN